MNSTFLDFEQPLADLDAKIRELGDAGEGHSLDIDSEIGALRDGCAGRHRTSSTT